MLRYSVTVVLELNNTAEHVRAEHALPALPTYKSVLNHHIKYLRRQTIIQLPGFHFISHLVAQHNFMTTPGPAKYGIRGRPPSVELLNHRRPIKIELIIP